ncbi:MAG: hypothetical protein IKK72_01525 [Oscillospiraceae bacterium]|nr:hypothetical protein [Oscillospiraceae bacterium]
MEMNAPWITCRIGSKLHLLARDEKAYYLVEVGKNLDYATEEWLESQGVSEELLKELQMPFTYIPKSDLRGVAITGNEAGEYIYLYLKSEKKKVMLELDYDPEWMNQFFFGFPRFTPPADKSAKKKRTASWRREKRDPALFDKLFWVSVVLGLVGLGVNIGFAFVRNLTWFALWLAVLAIPVLLVILMPAYFTLIPVAKGKKADAWELYLSLFPHIFGLMGMMNNNWLDDGVFWTVAGICAVVCLALLLLAEEFRREPMWLILFAVIGGFFGIGAVSEANELLPHEPTQSYFLEVEGTHKSGRRSKSYYCEITLPDGREESLEISRNLYNSLEEGDLVRVEVGEGFFGIEYANVYSAE